MKILGFIISAALLILLTGCASPSLQNPQNIVIVNPSGSLIDSNEKQLTNDLWMANIFGHVLTNAPSRTNILIFFQGGLNYYDDGVKRANNLSSAILADATSPYYPIFFDWDSSLFSSWKDHVTYSLNGSGQHSWKLLLVNPVADIGRMIGRIPATLGFASEDAAHELFEEILHLRLVTKQIKLTDTHHSHHSMSLLVRNPQEITNAENHLSEKGMHFSFGPTNKPSISAFWSYYFRALEGSLVAYPGMIGAVFVDTGGKAGWDQMCRRTDTMFTTPDTFADGGTEIFASSLKQFLKTNANYSVTIVAHSMGTIIANEIIRRHGPDLHIKNIVYMAAACGIEDFTKSVVPFLENNTNVHFYNLCLSPENEIAENHIDFKFNYDVPAEIITPHGSLLQWIDDYYSTAQTRFGWTMGKFENVLPGMEASVIPKSVYSRITVTCFDVGPLQKIGPQKHGDFTQVRFWEPDFWKGEWNTNMFLPN